MFCLYFCFSFFSLKMIWFFPRYIFNSHWEQSMENKFSMGRIELFLIFVPFCVGLYNIACHAVIMLHSSSYIKSKFAMTSPRGSSSCCVMHHHFSTCQYHRYSNKVGCALKNDISWQMEIERCGVDSGWFWLVLKANPIPLLGFVARLLLVLQCNVFWTCI